MSFIVLQRHRNVAIVNYSQLGEIIQRPDRPLAVMLSLQEFSLQQETDMRVVV